MANYKVVTPDGVVITEFSTYVAEELQLKRAPDRLEVGNRYNVHVDNDFFEDFQGILLGWNESGCPVFAVATTGKPYTRFIPNSYAKDAHYDCLSEMTQHERRMYMPVTTFNPNG